MTDSFQAVKTLSVTYAARDSVFDGQQIKQGQFLGLIDGRVAKVDESLEACIAAITEESVAGEESYVNVFYGEGIKEEEAENISSIVKSKLPQGAEVNVVYGRPARLLLHHIHRIRRQAECLLSFSTRAGA